MTEATIYCETNTILKLVKKDSSVQAMFLLRPSLERITRRLCNFISPLILDVTGDPLVLVAIRKAIEAYQQENDESIKQKAYVSALLDVASRIGDLKIQGVREDRVVTWEPYIEPMCQWMGKHDVKTLRTEQHDSPDSRAYSKLALRTHILTVQDMTEIGFV